MAFVIFSTLRRVLEQTTLHQSPILADRFLARCRQRKSSVPVDLRSTVFQTQDGSPASFSEQAAGQRIHITQDTLYRTHSP